LQVENFLQLTLKFLGACSRFTQLACDSHRWAGFAKRRKEYGITKRCGFDVKNTKGRLHARGPVQRITLR
jgi:hypothetical protein